MKRFAPLLLLLAAAAPAPTVTMVMAVPAPTSAPVYQPAPMPDPDAVAPLRVNQKGEAVFNPTTFDPSKRGFGGDGFVAGSTAQGEQERRQKPSGGVQLSMPLQ